MSTKKKITRVEGGENTDKNSDYVFTPTVESKNKATTLRIIAFTGWILAIGLELLAIFKFLNPLNWTWMIICVVIALVLAVAGNILWKKATRLDPASEKNKLKFFLNNQLGAIMSALAFIPLLIMVLTNKNLSGKQKGILGAIVGIALAIGVGSGVDTNAPSVEQYTEQTNEVEGLMGKNEVYWTESGKKYHLFDDCQHINRNVTAEIKMGTLAQARELKNITELCKTCKSKAEKGKTEIAEPNIENTDNQVEENNTNENVDEAA